MVPSQQSGSVSCHRQNELLSCQRGDAIRASIDVARACFSGSNPLPQAPRSSILFHLEDGQISDLKWKTIGRVLSFCFDSVTNSACNSGDHLNDLAFGVYSYKTDAISWDPGGCRAYYKHRENWIMAKQ